MKLWIRRDMTWDKILGSVLCLIGMGMLCISVYLSFSSDIWYDELFTMGLANQSCGKLVSITARDVHPPLYYMIVRLFLGISGGLKGDIAYQAAVAKLVSIAPFFLCMIYALTKVRKNFGMLTAGLFCFLLPAMPKLADYTVEVRMYGWALFFVTAGMLHAYELAAPRGVCGETSRAGNGRTPESREFARNGGGTGKKRRLDFAALTLYGLAACYTHYFACVAFAMIYFYLLIVFMAVHGDKEGRKKEIKSLFISGICCGAGYLPWLIGAFTVQISQVKENYWIQPLTWRSLGGCVKFIFQFAFSGQTVSMIAGGVLFAVYGEMLLLFLAGERKTSQADGETGKLQTGKETEKGRKADERELPGRKKVFFLFGCLGVPAGIVFFGFLASILIRPVFVYRYMLPALGVFWLAFAIVLGEAKEKKLFFIPAVLFVIVTGIFNYRSFYGEEMWKRVQMREARQALSQIGGEDIVIFNFDQTQAVASCYLNNDTYLWYGKPEKLIREMYPKNHALVEGEFSDEEGVRALKELLWAKEGSGKGKVWFFGSGNARDEIIEKWEKAGIMADEKASVMIERYWFNIYDCKLKSTE